MCECIDLNDLLIWVIIFVILGLILCLCFLMNGSFFKLVCLLICLNSLNVDCECFCFFLCCGLIVIKLRLCFVCVFLWNNCCLWIFFLSFIIFVWRLYLLRECGLLRMVINFLWCFCFILGFIWISLVVLFVFCDILVLEWFGWILLCLFLVLFCRLVFIVIEIFVVVVVLGCLGCCIVVEFLWFIIRIDWKDFLLLFVDFVFILFLDGLLVLVVWWFILEWELFLVMLCVILKFLVGGWDLWVDVFCWFGFVFCWGIIWWGVVLLFGGEIVIEEDIVFGCEIVGWVGLVF